MKKNEEIKLGEVLEELIKRFGISLTKLAKDTGIARSTLSDWKYKKNLKNINLRQLRILANYFGVSIEYLCFREESENSERKERANGKESIKEHLSQRFLNAEDEKWKVQFKVTVEPLD